MENLRELFVRFAKATKHKHSFVDGKCEFCNILHKECEHDDSNKKEEYKDGIISFVCSWWVHKDT